MMQKEGTITSKESLGYKGSIGYLKKLPHSSLWVEGLYSQIRLKTNGTDITQQDLGIGAEFTLDFAN